MLKRTLVILALALAFTACGRPGEVVGPFTGVVYRFRLDQLTVPLSHGDLGTDLDGDGKPHNELPVVWVAGQQLELPAPAIADLIGSGALHSIVEIQTNDPRLSDDPTVAVTFRGSDGAAAGTMGARLVRGHLETNPIRDTHTPQPSLVMVPTFGGADPWPLALAATQLQLTSDGHGGFDGILNGAARFPDYMRPLYDVFNQVVPSHPLSHGDVFRYLDSDGDGTVSLAEFLSNVIVESVTAPDLRLFDAAGRWAPHADSGQSDALSVGFAFHIVPCADAVCAPPPWSPTCADRVRNGDETDVDCGSSCGGCPPGLKCQRDADCQTRCVDGTCALPTCSDGVADGLETDVDCGFACHSGCAPGGHCIENYDCADGVCDANHSCG